MFTGIVEELGVVAAVEPLTEAARVTIACAKVLDDVTEGASIAVNGVCLTVTGWFAYGDEPAPAPAAGSAPPSAAFHADVMLETLARSSLGALAPGAPVNLERPVRLADRLGGHLVQGHVDGVGTVVERVVGEHWETVRIALPAGLDRYLVPKGSITVDGVSLTVVEVRDARPGTPASFTVSLIPTTLRLTTLGRRAPGDAVNLEVDLLGKYVERLLGGHAPPAVPPASPASPAAAAPPAPAAPADLTRSTTNGQLT
jgi:riboflavin synthase